MEGRNRKLNRWAGFDYSQTGFYFVTICTHNRIKWFGTVKNGKMILNEYGKIADKLWREIPKHYSGVTNVVHQIMPNHVHGVIWIVGTGHRPVLSANGGLILSEQNNNRPPDDRTEQCSVPTGPINDKYGLLSKIMKSYKEMVVKTIRKQIGNYEFAWQRSFHDRVIRNDDEFNRICAYIINNPINWGTDRNNRQTSSTKNTTS